MFISSKDNPKIKRLAALLSSKKHRSAEGVFVVEGVRSSADALKESLEGSLDVESLYFTDDAKNDLEERLGKDVFEHFDNSACFEITKELADKVSLEGNTQGAFVVARAVHKPLPESLSGKRYVVLDNIQDPGNLGTILRTADAVGADGVILTNNCAELYNPKVIRSTMGSICRTDTYVENSFEKVCSAFKDSGICVVAAVVREGELLSRYRFAPKCAVVIGNEGRGLSEEHIALCDEKVTIDMHGRLDSLNASVAAAVIMWEMSKEGC
ncbi:RNA methyltransferase [Ruminococcus sp. NK3A76]|uniref:TrmH family RNA methyltransferase n=1 Tax=Ruminococcus sp. NK3A76 TaxID=877411 RepID=UPI0004910580|nr:RNA methyltransferase [Ruminococcus sp. NK3A76]